MLGAASQGRGFNTIRRIPRCIVLAKVYEDYNRNARPARFMLEMSERGEKGNGFQRLKGWGNAARNYTNKVLVVFSDMAVV